jgi:hypothetical protein
MVLIQKHKTCFVRSMLHLPHGVWEEEPTAFYQINDVNINGVKWKLKNETYLKFLYIKYGVLLVRYRRNGWSQFVGVLIAKLACARNPVSNCFTLKLTSNTYSWHRTPQYSGAVDIIVTFFWYSLIAKAFGSGNRVSGLYFDSGIKSAIVPYKDDYKSVFMLMTIQCYSLAKNTYLQ